MTYIKYCIKNFIGFIFSILIPENRSLLKLLKLDQGEMRKMLPKAEDTEDPLTFPIFNYRNKDVRAIVWAIKYKGHPEMLRRIAEILYEEILAIAEEKMAFEGKSDIALIPIPINKKRLREKGFNQCELLCEEVEKLSIDQIKVFNILRKAKDTGHQTGLKRGERLQNMKGSMELRQGYAGQMQTKKVLQNSLLIIIDDVYTTGATIIEARRALAQADFKDVVAITLAH